MAINKVKRRKTHEIRFTKYELIHLRDLFTVVLPPDARKTVSQAMAELEGRTLVEASLWRKISDVCVLADLPVGDDAPDYVIAPVGMPTLSVFQVSSDPDEEEREQDTDDKEEEGDDE